MSLPTATSCTSSTPDVGIPVMRAFEDFWVGEVMVFGPVTVTAEDIKSFAQRFDPQPMHLDAGAEQNAVISGMFASGLHTVCLHMRLFADGVLRDSTSMGSPGVDDVRYLAPVRAGDTLTLRVEVIGARPSKSRPEMGLVHLHMQMINAQCMPAMELTATLMMGRRTVAGVDEAV
jgi:acyl dehydratase